MGKEQTSHEPSIITCRQRRREPFRIRLNPLVPKTIGTEAPQNTGTPEFLYQRQPKFTSPSKTAMRAGIVRIVRNLPSSPNTSGRATLTKKARTTGLKSITLNESGWKLQRDIRTAAVVCL
ncbi:hypothetical protein AVEN_244232-1 [Araneus ventricosus]|uniref:Uncharacterized protein n=1 Tax=Araneus ventricosus TaxID=182803 RepID=A0A4Y2KQP7_ARAVE|nr:hypothetical protein AVEN_244232-1 [Araneus ventricosus]